MSILQLSLTIGMKTGVTADSVVNTWHAGTAPGADDEACAEDFLEAVLDFYQGVNAGAGYALSGRWSNNVAVSNIDAKVVRLNDPKPRVPIFTSLDTTGWGAVDSTALPSELAVCASFGGTVTSGTAGARRRGRIFFGPVSTGVFTNSGNRVIVDPTFRQAMCDSMARVKAASDAAADWTWVVYSPTIGVLGASPTTAVTHGWVDDAPDVQRRRGVKPSARTNWT